MRLYSHTSGLKVVVTSAPGPQIDLGVSLATPATDDSGLPHTLEHLVFLGSQAYPYRGVLDLLANKVFADGTNAYTAQTETVYTASCHSREGFTTLLPIYMDHLLRPTLSDDAFHSEVYHMNKDNEDTGVVYSEMAARQEKDWSRLWRACLKSMYGDSVFSYDSGGLLEELRTLTNAKIREYHSRYYRLDNMIMCVTGSIHPNEIFEALEPWMDTWAPATPTPERPFTQSLAALQPLTGQSTVEILFPDGDDESPGSVAWVSRTCRYGDFVEVLALEALLELVCDTAVAPLRRALVDAEDALCADLAWDVDEGPEYLAEIVMQAVDPDNLLGAAEALRAELANAAGDADLFDMASPSSRLRKIIENNRWAWISTLENGSSLHKEIVHIASAFSCFAASDDAMTLERACRRADDYVTLLSKPTEWWQHLFTKRFVDASSAVVMARPSSELAAEMAGQEKERLQARLLELGEEEMRRRGREAEEAAERANKLPPPEVLAALPTPSLTASLFDVIYLEDGLVVEHPEDFVEANDDEEGVASSSLAGDPVALRSASLQSMVSEEIARGHVPRYPVMLADVGPSAFIEANVVIDTNELPDHLRPLLAVITSVLFELPVGDSMSATEATEHVEHVALYYWGSCGTSVRGEVDLTQALMMSVKTDRARFPDAVTHLASVFQRANVRGEGGARAVRAAASRVLQQASTAVRDGYGAVRTALADKLYQGRRLNQSATASLHLARTLQPFCEALEDVGSERADRALDTVANLLARLRLLPVRLTVVGDLVAGSGTYTTLSSAFGRAPAGVVPRVADLPRIRGAPDYPASPQPLPGTTVALTSPSEVAGYLVGARAGLPRTLAATRTGAAVGLVCHAASATEGPLFSRIRGCGAAYGAFLSAKPKAIATIAFKASNMPRAAEEFVKLASDANGWLPAYLQDGRSVATSRLISSVSSRAAAGRDVIARRLLQDGASVRGDVTRLQQVTLDEALAAFDELVRPAIVSPTVVVYVTNTLEADVEAGAIAAKEYGGNAATPVQVDEYFRSDQSTYATWPWAVAALALVAAFGGGGRP